MKERCLVVVAHADDEVLMCGGLLHAKKKVWDSSVLVVCDNHVRHGATEQEAYEQQRKAGECLGLPGYGRLGKKDQQLNLQSIASIAKHVNRLIERVGASIVITHNLGDLNADHKIVAQSVMVAARMMPVKVLGGYAPSSSEHGVFNPNAYAPISEEDLDAKCAAFACYKQEQQPGYLPRNEASLRTTARFFGSHRGVLYAEPFVVLHDTI